MFWQNQFNLRDSAYVLILFKVYTKKTQKSYSNVLCLPVDPVTFRRKNSLLERYTAHYTTPKHDTI